MLKFVNVHMMSQSSLCGVCVCVFPSGFVFDEEGQAVVWPGNQQWRSSLCCCSSAWFWMMWPFPTC